MTKQGFNSIQYLRGLAAMLVVIFHLGEPLAHMGYRGGWPSGLAAGVDIFFVISGFVMWVSTIGRPITPSQFFRKRVVRVVPLYWLLTSFMLLVLVVMPSAVKTSVLYWPHAIASYLFFPMINPGKLAMEPLLFPGWTLNYEMFYYVIFGLFLLTSPRIRLFGTASVLVLLTLIGAVMQVEEHSVAGFYTSPILLEFVVGMFIGALVQQRGVERLLGPTVAVLAITAGLALLLFSPLPQTWPRALRYGAPAAAIVLGALSLEGRGLVGEWRFAHIVGDASYSIYLTQLISMAAFRQAWELFAPPSVQNAMILYSILDLVVATSAGIICFYLVEKPLATFFTRSRKNTHDAALIVEATPIPQESR